MTVYRPTFYLGRGFDLKSGSRQPDDFLYDPADLTTHGFLTGMTGSGKTGLGIVLLEEAALCGIPAIIIDPKGDLTNLLLHFPDASAPDLLPWVNPDAARRGGITPEALAQTTADRWRAGLAEWGVPAERVRALDEAVNYAIYTPGSDAGLPVNMMASFAAPDIPWQGNRELLREKISSTVTALLSLVGLTVVDPLRSREHILLSNIMENAWSRGESLDLPGLIMRVQSPPFAQLGVFSVDSFLPEKERRELAMLLNNFLASPAFQVWLEGQPLNIPALLTAEDGKPRHSIFYLAHLSETERRFFVTLLFSAVETWMRSQGGASHLRLLIYFDEVMGYLPPVSNPPTKGVMLRMLKQARAFGVGLLLASQNPVDIDYQALANLGSWFIGKLQTDQDKQRLLDGLASAAGGFDRGYYDKLISALGQRVFLLHNVHGTGPRLFQTRWTMNYLAGPLTRAQIPLLVKKPGIAAQPVKMLPPLDREKTQPVRLRTAEREEHFLETRPAVPAGVAEYFMPANLSPVEALRRRGVRLPDETQPPVHLFRPALLGQARARIISARYGLDFELTRTVLVRDSLRPGELRWEDALCSPVEPRQLVYADDWQARFATLFSALEDARQMQRLQRSFMDWAARNSAAKVRANLALKVYAPPEHSTAAFRERCSEAARSARDAELAKIDEKYNRRLDELEDRLGREERELDQDQDELGERRVEELGTHVENFLSVFGRSRRRLSTSLTRHRLTRQAYADLRESKLAIKDIQSRIATLETEWQRAVDEVGDRWARAVGEVTEITLSPYKRDIYSELFGVVWLPYYVFRTGSETVEVSAYAC